MLARLDAVISHDDADDIVQEVFVKAFPDGRNPVKVSTSGGGEPRWRRDGRELYYLAPDCRLMAAAIGPDPEIEVQAPVPLFAYACDGSSVTGHVPAGRNQYDVTANGERFVVSERTEDSPITVVANWPALLRH